MVGPISWLLSTIVSGRLHDCQPHVSLSKLSHQTIVHGILAKHTARESPTTRIFLTGRPHVREPIQRYFAGVIVIPISPNTDDVRNYLEMKLDRDEDPEAMDDGLPADIVKTILDKVSDM